eukprot:48846_1
MKLYILLLIISITTITNAVGRPAQSEVPGLDVPLSEDEQASTKETNICMSDGQSDTASCDQTIHRDIEFTHDPNIIRSYITSTSARGIQIKNSRSYPVHYFWVNTHYSPPQGQYNGIIPPHSVTATVSYIGHKFYICKHRNSPQNESIFDIEVKGTQALYVVPPDENEEYDKTYWQNLQQEMAWSEQYEQKTGYPYHSYYDSLPGGKGPRPLPTLKFWPAEFIGQKHHVISNETYWHCLPDPGWSIEEASEKCRDKDGKGYIELDIEVLSLYPPIFKIMGTISSIESQYIIDYATPKVLRSRAGQHGGMVTDTRTSFNTWIGRSSHPIITTIYNRAADILGLERDDMKINSEQLQVLHYDVGQEYSPHHDYGSSGSFKQRVMTILFYLNNQVDQYAGGETFFPKAMGKGIKVHPGRGNSGLFYSILPDGNADDLSLHAALPVQKGEKWACNFWIWDPKFRG